MFTVTLHIILILFVLSEVAKIWMESKTWNEKFKSQSKNVKMSNVIEGDFDRNELINLTAAETNEPRDTVDVNITASFGGTVILNNCTLASTNEVNSTAHTFLDESALIALQRIDGTTENHRTHVMQAIITPDSTISRTASPSLRITPKSSTIPCNTSLFSFKVPVNSGQACTPVVYVRESEAGDGAAYNGSRVDLYVKANYNLGITSDTLLDTATAASDGAFEELTGTTSTVTDAGVLEFYLVCDGSVGWINADDFTATNA